MSHTQDSFTRFRQRVLDDPDLQQRLRGASEPANFPARVVEMGAELGYEFTVEEVQAALREARQRWIERWL
ncbi:MAG: Nif11-like leader peptide family natural product precursor [Xanthomonadales bacterium]|nr:Nif11-like leader peptide family natural product precursor [Xanthomonadales bacterium]